MTRRAIIKRATQHVGHKETAPNDSELIRKWLRLCGIDKPSAWCAAFASWCLDSRNIAGAVALGKSFPATDDPQPGDLMWFRTDDKGHGHIGIVVDVLPTLVLCIEGNSANQVRYVIRRRDEVEFSRTCDEEWTDTDVATLKVWDDAPLVKVSFEGTR